MVNGVIYSKRRAREDNSEKIMTRKKVKLAFISNESARKATLKKRKKGLMKKVSELSTLCGIESCAIVYSPYESQAEVWPDARGAGRVVGQFKRMPEMEQSKKMVNQESFIRHRIAKAADQLKKLHKDNRDKELTHLMYHCLTGKAHLHALPLHDLNDMACLLDHNLNQIYKRIQAINKAPSTAPAPAPAPPPNKEDQHHWFAEWMGNPTAAAGAHHHHHQGAFGDEIINNVPPFNDGTNHNAAANTSASASAAMWSNVFFP